VCASTADVFSYARDARITLEGRNGSGRQHRAWCGSPPAGDAPRAARLNADVVASRYEIRIKGRVTEALLPHLEGLSAHVEPVETTLYGNIEDQAALHGLLERIEALGLELIEVRRFKGDP
jgi:hypothetical protein